MVEFLRQFRWQDLVDIVLVSIILYRALLLIKGTRAAQMLIGLGILLVASIFSKQFQFYTIDWIVNSLWTQIVIVIIILFQPEIRKALAQMGESPFFKGFSSAEGLRSLEEIVKAAASTAYRGIGALIVIEREVSLKDYVEIGIPLDAKVSKELLLSIFHPSSPIHDGAVIIRGNRIVAAGCFLPIAIGTDVSKSLGTRHRAAIGITEETDAVAIIISEETGNISIAVGGRLETNLDMGSLRDNLKKLFTSPVKSEAEVKKKRWSQTRG